MKRVPPLKTFAASLLICTLTVTAQEKGYWRATSNTARSITGDITLSEEKLIINFSATPISKIRALNPTEVSAVFDTDSNAAAPGSFYRVNIPATKIFLHKNTLCGRENVQWMVAYAQGNTLQLAFFSGDKPPVFTFDALRNSTDVCGTYTYAK